MDYQSINILGLAIIIFMAQLPAFQYCTSEPLFIECEVDERQWLTFGGQPVELSLVLVHVAMCMAIMHFFPKIPKIGKLIPASLVGLLVGTLIEWTLFRKVIGQGTRTVSFGDIIWIEEICNPFSPKERRR